MASYKVRIKASAAKEVEAIEPRKVRLQIVDGIQRLADDPRPPRCEQLAGRADRYRVRQGVYRIVYSVADEVLTIFVVEVGQRSDVYRSR